jgi:hypothetical protein
MHNIYVTKAQATHLVNVDSVRKRDDFILWINICTFNYVCEPSYTIYN